MWSQSDQTGKEMFYIRKIKSSKWQACMRRKNYPTITKTFNVRSLASRYDRDIESKMNCCVFEDYTAAATNLTDIYSYNQFFIISAIFF